jgi:hypothetical protein
VCVFTRDLLSKALYTSIKFSLIIISEHIRVALLFTVMGHYTEVT